MDTLNSPTSRLENALAQLGAEHAPPAGWQDRVLAVLRTERAVRSAPASLRSILPWPRAKLAVFDALLMAAAVACIALGFAHRDAPRPARPLELAIASERAGPAMRGSSAQIGDIAHATARGGADYRAVWVYRRDRLVAACPGAPGCHDAGDAMTAEVALRAPGRYVFLALTSASPLPLPGGSYDRDAAAALAAGATVRSETLVVE